MFFEHMIKIPLYVIFVGGVKSACYVLPDVLLNPIVSDSFGFSEKETTYFVILFIGGAVISVALL